MKIGNKEFSEKGRTYVMGILNITPDSFSDGGRYQAEEQALCRVERMLEEGVDILDVGGESTRPGHTEISAEEEISRVIPIIQKIKSRFDAPVSLDTYKAEVAKEGIAAGVDMINDIWGLKRDAEMAAVIAEANITCCLMHNRPAAVYDSYMEDVLRDLSDSLDIAHRAGISDGKIILDPGVGFGKTYENNLEIIDRLEMLQALGYPILLGASRKSVIGLSLDLPVEERMEGTLVTSVYAVLKGAMFVRVHDVKENLRAVRMAEAIRDGYR